MRRGDSDSAENVGDLSATEPAIRSMAPGRSPGSRISPLARPPAGAMSRPYMVRGHLPGAFRGHCYHLLYTYRYCPPQGRPLT